MNGSESRSHYNKGNEQYRMKTIQKGRRKSENLFKLGIVFTGIETNSICITQFVPHAVEEVTLVFTLPEAVGNTHNPVATRDKHPAGHTSQFHFTAPHPCSMELGEEDHTVSLKCSKYNWLYLKNKPTVLHRELYWKVMSQALSCN